MNELTTTYEWGQVPWRKLEVAVFKGETKKEVFYGKFV